MDTVRFSARVFPAVLGIAFLLGICVTATPCPVMACNDVGTSPGTHRMYNPTSGEHVVIENTLDAALLADFGWHDEGTHQLCHDDDGTPAYRLYSPNSGEHAYALSSSDKNHLASLGWQYEGMCWYSGTDSDYKVFRMPVIISEYDSLSAHGEQQEQGASASNASLEDRYVPQGSSVSLSSKSNNRGSTATSSSTTPNASAASTSSQNANTASSDSASNQYVEYPSNGNDYANADIPTDTVVTAPAACQHRWLQDKKTTSTLIDPGYHYYEKIKLESQWKCGFCGNIFDSQAAIDEHNRYEMEKPGDIRWRQPIEIPRYTTQLHHKDPVYETHSVQIGWWCSKCGEKKGL